MNCLNGTVTVHRAYRSWNWLPAVGSFLLFEFSVFVLTLSPFPKQCFDRPRTERNENVQMDNRESSCRGQTENNRTNEDDEDVRILDFSGSAGGSH